MSQGAPIHTAPHDYRLGHLDAPPLLPLIGFFKWTHSFELSLIHSMKAVKSWSSFSCFLCFPNIHYNKYMTQKEIMLMDMAYKILLGTLVSLQVTHFLKCWINSVFGRTGFFWIGTWDLLHILMVKTGWLGPDTSVHKTCFTWVAERHSTCSRPLPVTPRFR